MIRSICLLALAGLTAFVTSCATHASKSLPESAFTPLFDGKSLDGWFYNDKKGVGYHVENGVIVCPKNGGGDLLTEKEYTDFVLRLEFKVEPGGNNGIAIRSPQGPVDAMAYAGNEIQVLDDAAPKHANIEPWQHCGSLYGVIPAKTGAPKPAGEWNTYEITAQGRHLKIVLNGQAVVDANLNDVATPALLRQHPGMLRDRGHIGFLGHAAHVEFRNIRIHELTRFYQNDNSAPEGFTRLFNGQNLENWQGLVADPIKRKKLDATELATQQLKADELMQKNWKVEKGTLVYRGDGFDNLCTKKEYGNFELLVDWKVDPKADSGLYLRGCPQVQIWEPNSPSYGTKKPGSGGLFNNKTGASTPLQKADRMVGEWNRFRILMVDNRVTVFLNDDIVVRDTALENYWDYKQPVFAYGPLELQAHKSVAHFKNIYVREIPGTPQAVTK